MEAGDTTIPKADLPGKAAKSKIRKCDSACTPNARSGRDDPERSVRPGRYPHFSFRSFFVTVMMLLVCAAPAVSYWAPPADAYYGIYVTFVGNGEVNGSYYDPEYGQDILVGVSSDYPDYPDIWVEADGSPVTLTADAANGYVFSHWTTSSGDDYSPSITLNGEGDLTVTFVIDSSAVMHDIDVNISGNGKVMWQYGATTGDFTSTGTITDVPAGETITFSQAADSGNVFLYWTTDSGTNLNSTLQSYDVNADRTITAKFGSLGTDPNNPLYREVDFLVSGFGTIGWSYDDGSPISGEFDASGILYAPSGKSLTLTAHPDTGYYFMHWIHDDTATSDPVFTIDEINGDEEITAEFEVEISDNYYWVNIDIDGNGYVKYVHSSTLMEGTLRADGTIYVPNGDTVTLTAVSNSSDTIFWYWDNGTYKDGDPTHTSSGAEDIVMKFEINDNNQYYELPVTVFGNGHVTWGYTHASMSVGGDFTSRGGTVILFIPATAVVTLTAVANLDNHFVYWIIIDDDTDIMWRYEPDITVDGTIDLTVDYQPDHTYDLTYDANNGTGYVKVVNDGGWINLSNGAGFTMPEWEIIGWSESPAGPKHYDLEGLYNHNHTGMLYAIWGQYTITYDTKGGGTAPSPILNAGDGIVLDDGYSLSKSGWYFAGWSDADDDTAEYGTGVPYNGLHGDITLYAVWAQYTVTYDPNGGTGSASAKGYGNTVLHDGSGFARADWYISGWNTSADGTGTDHALSAAYDIAGDVTLYAVWAQHTVSYDPNGGTGTIPDQVWGESVNLSDGLNFTKTGEYLKEWNTSADGTGTSYALGMMNFTDGGATTLYAIWTTEPTFIVRYIINGGTGYEAPSVHSGSVTLSGGENISMQGHTLTGWNTSADGTGTAYELGGTYSFAGNTDLYAVWTSVSEGEDGGLWRILAAAVILVFGLAALPRRMKLIYHYGHPYEPVSVKVRRNTVLNDATEFPRPGYVLKGWATSPEGPAEYMPGNKYSGRAKNLYAVWKEA